MPSDFRKEVWILQMWSCEALSDPLPVRFFWAQGFFVFSKQIRRLYAKINASENDMNGSYMLEQLERFSYFQALLEKNSVSTDNIMVFIA